MPDNRKKSNSSKQSNPKKNNTRVRGEKKEHYSKKISPLDQVMPYILGLLAVCVAFCIIFTDKSGFIGRKIIKPLLGGFFGAGAFSVPLFIFIHAITWKKDAEKGITLFKFVSGFFALLSLSVIVHTVFLSADNVNLSMIKSLWSNGSSTFDGGGFFGGIISVLFVMGIDKPLTFIVFVPLFIVFFIFLMGLTPAAVFSMIKEILIEQKAKMEDYSELPKVWHNTKDKSKLKVDDSVYEPEIPNTKNTPVDVAVFDKAVNDKNNTKKTVDVALEDKPPFDPDVALDEAADNVNKVEKDKSKTIGGVIDLDSIYYEDRPGEKTKIKPEKTDDSVPDAAELELMVEKKKVNEALKKPEKAEPAPVKEYVFPPLAFLKYDNKVKKEDVSNEMRTTAVKLVETLRSFKVKTKIVDVSRGPTITRYELAPEEGVRVRTIANLVDDISLNLASAGIRIEAPIPGKAAVGIEVPNKIRSNVYLRELIDTQEFRQAKSKVTVCLGKDVAGAPVFLDIAKMPHLLIAGATGMGKSVCLNSMIVSLLYKATPDEVKLILIDPKKVEFNLYAGLPHLLVPVVTDPKKAAGSLHWAVTEMDRRFELIESVGARDLPSYNNATRNDPDKEYLPQVVIVIDELADLMMTAPDDVEESICRLAQKARAAGMHLVIGTQRPSVDVVTGLIKGNIPSRIACTMASQVDSRTIIDVAGAEKLIGKGDMLYAPVGATGLSRVQGTFVCDEEIEKICNYIRTNSGVSSYDAGVIESIEKEAAKCGMGKKGMKSGFDAEDTDNSDEDPLFRAAVELAVETGKISTSLLQRRLSVGYGRAAKLVDKMEQQGIVSAPDGQKPRTVLISYEDFMERSFRNDE